MEKWICRTTGLECIKCNIGCEHRKVVDETRMTNYERIKSMTKREMTDFLFKLLDEDECVDIGCFSCCNYGTHHYKDCNGGCDRCYFYDVGDDIIKWLNKEENRNE